MRNLARMAAASAGSQRARAEVKETASSRPAAANASAMPESSRVLTGFHRERSQICSARSSFPATWAASKSRCSCCSGVRRGKPRATPTPTTARERRRSSRPRRASGEGRLPPRRSASSSSVEMRQFDSLPSFRASPNSISVRSSVFRPLALEPSAVVTADVATKCDRNPSAVSVRHALCMPLARGSDANRRRSASTSCMTGSRLARRSRSASFVHQVSVWGKAEPIVA